MRSNPDQKITQDDVEITLFNAENHLVFTPLLADVIGASVNPLDVVVPLRQLLPGVRCRTEEISQVHAASNEVEFRSSDGRECRLGYDHLVLACGNVANLHVVPGMADHAFALKNIGDAVALRSHVMEQMERAETCAAPARRRWFLSFIVVGAGYSGVEAAGEINDLARSSARYFQNFRPEDITVTLVHARDEILPEIASGLRHFARRQMERAGVRILLNARVASATAEGVALDGGGFLHGGTVVCTVGSSPAPILERLPVAREKGRLIAEANLRVRGTSNVWATGDWIVRQGESSTSLYVVETGEVEMIRSAGDGTSEVIGVLRAGAFFGERALLRSEPLDYSVRARTPLKVLVMGRNVFTHISSALAPLRDAVADTLNRRSIDFPRLHPGAHAALKDVVISDLMEAAPAPLLPPTATMADVGRAFAEHHHEWFYVCSEGQALEGMVTLTDWLRALSRGLRPETPVVELMVREPIMLSADENGLAAAEAIREHRVKHLPVVKSRGHRQLVGCLRTRRLMAHVFGRVEHHTRMAHPALSNAAASQIE